MTARTAAAVASLALALTVSACNDVYEVPIETPIQPKMDVSPFQRVLIAGFLAGGSEDVDANLETVRLLRSQLRSKSQLQRHRRRRAAAAGTGQRAAHRQGRDRRQRRVTGDGARGGRRRRPPRTPRRRRSPAEVDDVQQPRDQGREGLRAARGDLRQRRFLEEDRRGIPEPADRHRLGAVHRRTRDRASCSASRK